MGYRNDRFFSHTNPYILNVTQQADARRCSYFELGLPVVADFQTGHFVTKVEVTNNFWRSLKNPKKKGCEN